MPVAIKRLRGSKATSTSSRRALHNEIDLMRQMNHKNILRPIAYGECPEAPFLVLPIVVITLEQYLTSKAAAVSSKSLLHQEWPLTRALRIGVQIAEALHYCHSEMSPDFRVLHRDLKPSNIGFLASGDVVIFDFGLAKRCNRQTVRCVSPSCFMP